MELVVHEILRYPLFCGVSICNEMDPVSTQVSKQGQKGGFSFVFDEFSYRKNEIQLTLYWM